MLGLKLIHESKKSHWQPLLRLLRWCSITESSHYMSHRFHLWISELELMMTSSNGNICPLLVICEWNSPVTGEFPAQRPVMRSFDVFFDLRLNEGLSKQSWGWWFETPSFPFWRHNNVTRSTGINNGWMANDCQVPVLLIEANWCHGAVK